MLRQLHHYINVMYTIVCMYYIFVIKFFFKIKQYLVLKLQGMKEQHLPGNLSFSYFFIYVSLCLM